MANRTLRRVDIIQAPVNVREKEKECVQRIWKEARSDILPAHSGTPPFPVVDAFVQSSRQCLHNKKELCVICICFVTSLLFVE